MAFLVFVMVTFIFKFHAVDLPHMEASNSHTNDNHPHIHMSGNKEPPGEKQIWRDDGPKIDDDNFAARNITVRKDGDPDRMPIYKILEQAGFDTVNDERFTEVMFNSLPKWSEVLEMYGEPKIIGLETCEYYRESVNKPKWKLAVAGNFNSGTNFLYELLRKNCAAPPLWQVPW